MFTILFKHKILTTLIFAFLLLSILCQVIAGVIYQGMIKEAENMSATENKILKQCRQKYANFYKLNGRMVNTAAFVDKFLQNISIMGIPLVKFSHMAGQLMLASVLVTGISVCLSLAAGNTLFQIIPYYLISILGLYLYFSVAGIMDLQEKRNALKINLMDYLENHFIPRLEIEKEVHLEEKAKKREERVNAYLEEFGPINNMANDLNTEGKQQEPSGSTSLYDQDELESLLEEFFA